MSQTCGKRGAVTVMCRRSEGTGEYPPDAQAEEFRDELTWICEQDYVEGNSIAQLAIVIYEENGAFQPEPAESP